MTSVKFLADEKRIYGFSLSGHCSKDGDDEIGKIVCAAVSSAAYMTANTITEIIGDEAAASVDEAKMLFEVKNPSDSAVKVLEGFKLHLEELSDQYSNNIRIYGGAKYVKD
ncbi:MAG: ribosomal-processing cysteine protease Prp [Ruminococcaceae bacterium]|nr:ribosomal-processing cysteine protease Prp [Oscillospiraceae bacterium]